ncbi:MAG: GntR family transcriptional regulator [Bacillota bacterium]|nr:GntR family transcriptional regulator [Bacillota bacterium]
METGTNFPSEISLTEGIANILRERILKGEYDIGQRLKEVRVAEEMKVSRTPIREAFQQLEREGLMEVVPNRGAFVRGFTRQDIRDIYAVRAAVEALAVEWAIEKMTGEDLKTMEEIFGLMEFYTNKRNSRKLTELNRNFHAAIYEAGGSRFLSQVLKSYQSYVEQTRKVTVYCEKNLDQILREHRDILQAMREKDNGKAQKRMALHLQNSRLRAEEGLKAK